MKRIFTLLLAICLMAALLPVIASAEGGNDAFLSFPSADDKGVYTRLEVVLKEGETKYFLTNDTGAVLAAGASADNYNIKLDYPTGGTPTMYLKGAYISTDKWTGLEVGRFAKADVTAILDFDLTIYTETESTIYGGTNEQGGMYCGIECYLTGTLTVTGPGKLTIKSAQLTALYVMSELVFKDTTVDIISDMTAGGKRPAINSAKDGDVTFDNTVANIYANQGPCIWVNPSHYEMDDTQERDVIIKNGSKVTMANDNESNYLVGTKGKFVIDNSDVEMTANFVDSKGPFNPKPEIINATAIAGKKKALAKEYDPAKVNTYKYFKTTAGTGSVAPDPTEPADTTPTTKPADTTPTTKPDTSNPTTGDAFSIVLATALMLSSAAGAVVIGKKK